MRSALLSRLHCLSPCKFLRPHRAAVWCALLLGAVALMLSGSPATAAQVRVAVAANFSAPMTAIAAEFEKDTGHSALLAFGSTGKLYAQIRNGAPFDLLLAADQVTPARLEREGEARPGSRFTYAVGRLVLWSPQPGLVDAQGAVLRSTRFDRIAIADPKLAPYGAAAVEVMQGMGVRQTLLNRTVQGESISTAYQWVRSGSVALGFVALSQVLVEGKMQPGSAWVVPAALHTPIKQDALALQRSKDNPAATALLAYLKSDKALRIMGAYGYTQ